MPDLSCVIPCSYKIRWVSFSYLTFLSTGDIVSVELIQDRATFFVNYKKVSGDIKVSAWPLTFAVLLVLKGDQITLLREEIQDDDEYRQWLLSRPGTRNH